MTQWTAALQAPLSMGFFRQEYWSGLPCPPPGDLPDPGIKPTSPALQADSLLSEQPGKPPPQIAVTVNCSPKSVLPFHTVLESSLFTWTCGTTEDASVPPDLIIPLLVLCTTCSWGTFTPKSQHLFLFGRGLPLDCESPRCLCPRVL